MRDSVPEVGHVLQKVELLTSQGGAERQLLEQIGHIVPSRIDLLSLRKNAKRALGRGPGQEERSLEMTRLQQGACLVEPPARMRPHRLRQFLELRVLS